MGGCASAPIEFRKGEAPVEPEEQVEKATEEDAPVPVAVAIAAEDEKNPSLGSLLQGGDEEKKEEVEEVKKEAVEEEKKKET